MKPKISVVIPTYNEEKYIGATLFHIKKQKPYEIIVADSYSKDKTVKIARDYGAKITYVKRKNAAVGRNAGAKVAKGDVLLFLDADTIAFDNLLEVVKKDFKDKKLVGWTCPIYAFSPNWKEHLIYHTLNTIIEFLIKVVKKPHCPGVIMVIKKEIFNIVGGFDENLTAMEDHDMALRTGKRGKYKFSKETCVFTSTRRLTSWGIRKMIKTYIKAYYPYYLKIKKKQRIKYSSVR